MMERKQKNFKVRRDTAGEFARVCEVLGLDEYEAAELALHDWVKKHHDEAQKKLDLYAEKGITIIEPQTVNIAVFQKAEVLLAKEENPLIKLALRCIPCPYFLGTNKNLESSLHTQAK